MQQLNDLRVFRQARSNIRAVAKICTEMHGFGDLTNQIKRSAISVASNIAEGVSSRTSKQMLHFLGIARASNTELLAQIMIASDLGYVDVADIISTNIESTGKMLTNLIKYHRNKFE